MRLRVVGIRGEMKRIRNELISMQQRALLRLAPALRSALYVYMSNSPVWSGETVRNYRISVGSPPSGTRAPVQGKVDVRKFPWPDDVKNEQRRGANEAAAMAEAEAVIARLISRRKLPAVIWIKNTIDPHKAGLIEAGIAPTPLKSRYPGGLTIRATQTLIAKSNGLFT